MTGTARKSSRRRKLKNDNNVALGDILTLIFGFFVLMVTLNKYAIVQETGAVTASRAAEAKTVESNKGIGFPAITVLSISENEFQRIVLGKEPFHIPESIRNNSHAITIEACVSKQGIERADQRLWERSAARAERVGALLRSAGVASERISIRTVGGHCEVISQKDKEKQSVAIKLG